jgi:N-acetylmuramoyl-L-alanine amidase
MVHAERTRGLHRVAAIALLCTLVVAPAAARSVAAKKQIARSAFDQAERMREALNGRPSGERTQTQYQRVIDAYRKVYYTAPTSNRADVSVLNVAELLAEQGRKFDDPKMLSAAIGQYEFLRREYPGSKHRFGALFAIGEIYRDDVNNAARAKATFQEFLRRYPSHPSARDAREAIAQMDVDAAAKKLQPKSARNKPDLRSDRKDSATSAARNTSDENAKESADTPLPNTPAKTPAAGLAQPGTSPRSGKLPLVTGVRHWSTPDYTRVAIDLEQEVGYDVGRVPNPDRIFFDLHNTKLASGLVGKEFEVEDGLLLKIRIAQYQKGQARVVLDVGDIADYSAFLLPNPYRLIVDIHGKKSSAANAKNSTPVTAAVEKPGVKLPEQTAAAELKADTPKDAPKDSPKDAPKPDTVKSARSTPPPTGNVAARETARKSDSSDVPALPSGPEIPVKTAAKRDTPSPRADITASKSDARRSAKGSATREAKPTASGDRSLIRALGLKIGRIVLDPGHGGHDTGTLGPTGLQEKELVLDVSLRLGKLLESRLGADVVYTRDDDTFIPLETRTAIANREQADLFVSVHANSSNDPGARGIETYYLNFSSSADALEVAARENAVSDQSIHELQDLVKKIALKEKIEESREFAGEVQHALHAGLSVRGASMRDRGVKKAPFIVLIGANMPSILAEISFLSNPSDERRLKTPEYRQKIAESLYRGVARYVSGLSGVKVASSKPGTP